MTLTLVTEKLAEIIKNATKTPVKVGWISPNDNVPLITIMHMGGGAEAMALTNKTLRTYEFQIDIWHKSAKSRDEKYENIVDSLLAGWHENYAKYGWWSVQIYRTLDIEEEGVFRKTMLLTLKEVV